jgi:hypothetical protein
MILFDSRQRLPVVRKRLKRAHENAQKTRQLLVTQI